VSASSINGCQKNTHPQHIKKEQNICYTMQKSKMFGELLVFFFVEFRKLLEGFADIFQEPIDPDVTNDEPQDNGQGIDLLSQYGWLLVVYQMANKDMLKFKEVYELSALEFLNYAVMLNDIKKQEEWELRMSMNNT